MTNYPETAKIDHVDTYFGVEVPDPYRWLENDTSEATGEWVKAENEVTFGYLNHIPYRDKVKSRLEDLMNYERVYAPTKHGNWEYFYRNDGLQNQNVFYRKKVDSDVEEVFLNPNNFREDGTISLAGTSFTADGSLVAYQISEGGSDWRKAIIMNTETKEILGDTLKDIKFSGLSWRGTDGFYYSSYDKPKGSELSSKTQQHKLFYHKLGTAQAEDELIFGGENQERRYVGAGLTEDERFLIISASESTSGNELYFMDLSLSKPILVTVVDNFDNNSYILENEGEDLFIHTNFNAPNNRLVKVNSANPTAENWVDVIPETENVLSSSTGGGKIFARYLVDAKAQIVQYLMDGTKVREIELPGIGSAYGFGALKEDTSLYYTFTSFTTPSAIYKYDINTGKSELYIKPKVAFNLDDYVTEQVFYESKDGTKVPMFIVYKKGIELNGKNPTYLYAYGGFNVSLTPRFSTSRIIWLENGGIYAQPNLRGGGEYGEKWHLAGTKMQKQNVFDDFIAAAQYLKDKNYTSSDYLAIAGGSNGGLLVGAIMTQQPDIAKVAFPAVGVMDMLRYHKFTAGAGWAYDYGTADDSKEMFEYLKGYSPVHNLKPANYPATMVTTADHDDRVVPAHSFKFAATLQENQLGPNPVLIRIETNAGHGAGTPTTKRIEQAADSYSFAWYNMGVIPDVVKKGM
ncbi:MAG: prolyl oligopeptidase family serine peptidase [Cyclobacteriaceae bacterium]|nr:prolyl oligopeptidase family serine peptidase [Cyclobacteriaceae bacterium]